jgi:DNA polymerase III subunit delta
VLGAIDYASVNVLISTSTIDRRKTAAKWLFEHGTSEWIEDGKGGESLAHILDQEAAALGVSFAPGVAALLAAKVQGNARVAVTEVAKLTNYLGGSGIITEALLTELVPPFGEGDMFEAAEAFFSFDLQWTLDAVRRHFFAGHDARMLLTSLQNRNRLLIQLKALQLSNLMRGRISDASLKQAAAQFGDVFPADARKSASNIFSQNPWYLARLAKAADSATLRRLIDFQSAFIDAFAALIERPHDNEGVIRELAIRCLR